MKFYLPEENDKLFEYRASTKKEDKEANATEEDKKDAPRASYTTVDSDFAREVRSEVDSIRKQLGAMKNV